MPHKSVPQTPMLVPRFTGNGCTWCKLPPVVPSRNLMLPAAKLHFTDFFTPNSVLPAKSAPLFRLPHVYSRVSSTALGRRDGTSPEKTFQPLPAADMNEDLNPQAMPFRPAGGSNDPRLWNRSGNENIPPSMPPFGHPGAPWNMGLGPPPHMLPPQFFAGNMPPLNGYEAHQQAQAFEQARAHHHQWVQNHGHAYPGPPLLFQPPPFGQPPMYPPQHYPPHFPPQRQPPPPPPRQPNYAYPAHHQGMQQVNWSQGASHEELQAPTQPTKKSKKAKAKAKAAASGEDAQEYGTLHRVDRSESCSSRVNKTNSVDKPARGKKGKYGDEKIMLPAPQPTDLYMNQAAEEPSVIAAPGHLLVILDLNGTVLFRPNKNARSMIARPYLRPFLQYLFQSFKVMVWSSAKPATVKSLVDQSLDKDLRSMLVASWARDTFGLSATNFNQNVQVYKNLRLIWSRDQIQQHHPEYEAGKRFGQHNTVLIDDSALKASAQPHNLLEIPEFEATPEQMAGDVLREVAGYLEILRHQADVSKFISKQPFKGDGRWSYEWPKESADGGDMKDKVTLKGKRSPPETQVSDVVNTFSTVSLGGAHAGARTEA
ncbi:HAD-like domain-containing protein [Ampelomyces quisqualis]|uniref:Mitochondrial import inner membrane translocase subunit TIM50 n=1 Tax=Ampelomyces quisqualis TaxID=50730 RepID=A0A6A5QQY7_AMPQU|nr:HAD-like domain-containing protein [Ampelomyces quisqualis]